MDNIDIGNFEWAAEDNNLCNALKATDIEDFRWFARENNLSNTLKAIDIAIKLHKGQDRRTGEEYVLHPIRVALAIKQFKIYDDIILATALLHDVIEDCNVTKDDLVEKYGFDPIVAENVQILTQDVPDEEYYHRISNSSVATIGKLFDRYDNIKTMMGAYKPEKMKLKIKETETHIGKLIKNCKGKYPEYSDVVSRVEDHIQSLFVVAKAYIHVCEKNKALIQKDETMRNLM